VTPETASYFKQEAEVNRRKWRAQTSYLNRNFYKAIVSSPGAKAATRTRHVAIAKIDPKVEADIAPFPAPGKCVRCPGDKASARERSSPRSASILATLQLAPIRSHGHASVRNDESAGKRQANLNRYAP
jgi:hypothetical protein